MKKLPAWSCVLSVLLLVGLQGCGLATAPGTSVREFTVLYTNDEHGWMEGIDENRGAASLLQQWREQEGYSTEGPFLLLSGGDNWTGPAISTWSRGESMVEVMNTMGYRASAVGNHEFDFGLDALRQRSEQASYDYLSANIVWRDSGESPADLGILPWSVERVNGIDVAIIGLTTLDTPTATMPTVVAPLLFQSYERALRAAHTRVMSEDPDVVLVISHVCMDELKPLAEAVSDLEIAMFGGGHCNELVAERLAGSVILGGGYHFSSYARASFAVDVAQNRVTGSRIATVSNDSNGPAPDVAEVIARWQDKLGSELDRVIAYSDKEYSQRQRPLQQAIVDSWLAFDATAELAITNAGGLRTALPSGAVTLGDVFAIMPFDNTVIAVEVRGDAVQQALERGSRPVVAGVNQRGSQWYFEDGSALEPERVYRVLINSFMYAGGDGYETVSSERVEGFDFGVNYREPFVRWLEAQNSTLSDPLQLD